jgi:hypothetical protein
MPRVGFEPTTTVFERGRKVFALDRATTMIGIIHYLRSKKKSVLCESHGRSCVRDPISRDNKLEILCLFRHFGRFYEH